MSKDNLLEPVNPALHIIKDGLTEFIRTHAAQVLQAAIEAEANELIHRFQSECLDSGKRRIVKNGHFPEREIQTGVGAVPVKVPRVRDRKRDTHDKVAFTSQLIPKYMRRTATIDIMLPILYLKGISTNDFANVLAPMLGEQAQAISPSVISSLKKSWHDEFLRWQNRDLSNKNDVYFWVDGVYLRARSESEKTGMLIIIGADVHGNKELVALCDGFRESKASWRSLLMDLKTRGITTAPHLAIGDGALGFWGAVTEIYPATEHQRCWVHKTINVLDKLPKSLQSQAKSMLHEIYLSETKYAALKAFDKFIARYADKYPKATDCLCKDKRELMVFYNYPARHWPHIRTTNPIESTFATVKHRTRQSRGCFSRETMVASTFKLLKEAEKRWKKLYGYKQLADVVNRVKFIDGVDERTVNLESQTKVAA